MTTPTPRGSSATADTTLSSITTRHQPRTESELSPFFFRLDDSISSRPPSMRFSAVSSFSSNPDAPNPPPRPGTPLEPGSWSAFARRQWSRLSHLASDDADSVVSEPASYSHAAYVASDLWLVQKDVPNAEKAVTERGRKKREKMTAIPQRSWTAEYRNDEMGSSRLISQFFSGRNTPTVGPTRQDRRDEMWSSSKGVGVGSYQRRRGRPADRGSPMDRKFYRERKFNHWPGESRETRDTRNTDAPHRSRHPQFQEQEFGPFVRRRFSRARKFRWWLRRVTHRVRDDWEYNM